MDHLEVIINTCSPDENATLKFDKDNQYVIVCVPHTNHEHSIEIKNEFLGWKVRLSHRRTGYGKPYLLHLENTKQRDRIKISMVVQSDDLSIRTNLLESTFTSLTKFTLTAPNITTYKSQIDKTQDGVNLDLVSTGTLRISAHPLAVRNVSLTVLSLSEDEKESISTCSNDIFIDAGALVKCNFIETNIFNTAGHVFINGTLTTGYFGEELNVKIKSSDLHIGIDAIVGHNSVENQSKRSINDHKHWLKTKVLNLDIHDGGLTNFGSLIATDCIKLNANGLSLCSDSKRDTAHRGLDGFIGIKKDQGFIDNAIKPKKKGTSSFNDDRMIQAVHNSNCQNFLSIVQEGVDPNILVDGRRVSDEVKIQQKNVGFSDQENLEIIRTGLHLNDWKHGMIKAPIIECTVTGDIEDCSQIQGSDIRFNVGGCVIITIPWTWISKDISGQIRGDLIFNDNAIIGCFKDLQVLGNVVISNTSTLYIQRGGRLYSAKTLVNSNEIICEGDLQLDVVNMKQTDEGLIINKGDLLVNVREQQEQTDEELIINKGDLLKGDWFGNILVHNHFFLQLQKKVVVDAHIICKECTVQFFGEESQLEINGTWIADVGVLNLEADEHASDGEIPNLVLVGQLFAKGIEGMTASIETEPGALCLLTESLDPAVNEINIDVKWLKIKSDSVISCTGAPENYKMSNTVNVNCQEELSIFGELRIAGINHSNIHTQSLKNSGQVLIENDALNTDRKTKTKPLMLKIKCEQQITNTGLIKCQGSINIECDNILNKNGIIDATPDLMLKLLTLDTTALEGTLLVDGRLNVESASEDKLFFSAIGGSTRSKQNEEDFNNNIDPESDSKSRRKHFAITNGDISDGVYWLPQMFFVSCPKGHFALCTSMQRTRPTHDQDSDVEVCLFEIYDHLQVNKPSLFGKIIIEMHQSAVQEKNTSTIQINDITRADSLMVSSNQNEESLKPTLHFDGSSDEVTIKAVFIDKSIQEVHYNMQGVLKCDEMFLYCDLAIIESNVECVELIDGTSIEVRGKLKCGTPDESSVDSEGAKIYAKQSFMLDGNFQCYGRVMVEAEEIFDQKNTGRIEILDYLELTTSENGSILLEGLIVGTKETSKDTSLDIAAKTIKISGNIADLSSLKLSSENDLILAKESRIQSCQSVDINGEWITVAGYIADFQTIQMTPWGLLNSGRIESTLPDSTVNCSSHLALVNSGSCQSEVGMLEAPFLLSLPGKEINNVNEINNCQLVGRSSIQLESITCFLGGSALKSERLIKNHSVLLFKFLSFVSSTPDSKSLEAWTKAADSLRQIQSDYKDRNNREDGLFALLKSLLTGSSNTSIDLRLAEMYNMVNIFVGDILQNGIESFDVPRLVFIITSESERYTRVNILKEKLLAIPEKARKLRQEMKKRGIKSYQSIMSRFGFNEVKRSNATEGIAESGMYSFGEGAMVTDYQFIAMFDELFCDEGFVSAGDVMVSSKEILMSKRQKNVIAMRLFADQSISAGDIDADTVLIKSGNKAKLTGKVKAKDALIDAEGDIDMRYKKKGKWTKTANHEFKKLSIKTKKINQANDLLATEGIYQDLKISDQLNLAVSDQDIVLSRCNIEQSFQLNLQAKSVKIDKSNVNYAKGLAIESENQMSVKESSIGSSEASTVLKTKTGDMRLDSSSVEAKKNVAVVAKEGSIQMTGGSVSGDKGVLVKAKKDVKIDPIETKHDSSSSKSGFFTSKASSTSYSTVEKAHIKSKDGNIGVVAEEGEINMTATELDAGQDINMYAKKDVVVSDKVTTRTETHVKKTWFTTRRRTTTKQESHKSRIKARGNLFVKSDKGSIIGIGTDYKVGGDMYLHAAEDVTLRDRILNSSKESSSSGISLSLDKGLSFGSEETRSTRQTLAENRADINGNLIVSAKNFNVQNAMGIDAENMSIDAQNVNFEGADLHNTSYMNKWSFGINLNQLDLTGGESRSKEKNVVNQNINIRGKTHLENVENVNLIASNLNTTDISGQVKNLNVISKQSEIDAQSSSFNFGCAIVDGVPVPNKFGMSNTSDTGKFVEQTSGIHCNNSIKDLKVDNLKLKGSSITSNGDVGNFAKNIISEKIKSYRSQTSFGFSIGASKQGTEFGMQGSQRYMEMEHQGTIASATRNVDNTIKAQVNTDIEKHAKITKEHESAMGFRLKVEKDGVGAGIQTNKTSIGFMASKKEVGIDVKHGDKGISVSGGKSGASGSIQDGDKTFGGGISKKNVNMNIQTKSCSLNATAGKKGVSGSVESNGIAISGSSSKGSKSFSGKVGELETGFTREKNEKTGKKMTHGSAKYKDIGVSGSTSKGHKAINFQAKDLKTGVSSTKDKETGQRTTSANFNKGDFGINASNSKDSKSFAVEKGDLKAGMSSKKDNKTGQRTTSANINKGDLAITASNSKDSKSLNVQKGDFKTGVSSKKDKETGQRTTSANINKGDLAITASNSKDSKSLDVQKGDFKTGVSSKKDKETGQRTTSANINKGDLAITASNSKDSKSLDVQKGDFKTGVSSNKDKETGQRTTSANINKGDLAITASNSKDSKSLNVQKGDFKTGVSSNKDKETGQRKNYFSKHQQRRFGNHCFKLQRFEIIGRAER
ncbi:uncharacterized protein [Clytia hemisphaerica]